MSALAWTEVQADDTGQEVIITLIGVKPVQRLVLPYRIAEWDKRTFSYSSASDRPPRLEQQLQDGTWANLGKPGIPLFQHWCNYAERYFPLSRRV